MRAASWERPSLAGVVTGAILLIVATGADYLLGTHLEVVGRSIEDPTWLMVGVGVLCSGLGVAAVLETDRRHRWMLAVLAVAMVGCLTTAAIWWSTEVLVPSRVEASMSQLNRFAFCTLRRAKQVRAKPEDFVPRALEGGVPCHKGYDKLPVLGAIATPIVYLDLGTVWFPKLAGRDVNLGNYGLVYQPDPRLAVGSSLCMRHITAAWYEFAQAVGQPPLECPPGYDLAPNGE